MKTANKIPANINTKIPVLAECRRLFNDAIYRRCREAFANNGYEGLKIYLLNNVIRSLGELEVHFSVA